MIPHYPRRILNEFLEFFDRNAAAIGEDPRNSQRLMDWLAVETLESKELREEINLLLTLETEIEADCLQASIEIPEGPEEIPVYRRPALETLLAKWRQNLNRIGAGRTSPRSTTEGPEGWTTGLFEGKFDVNFFGEKILFPQPLKFSGGAGDRLFSRKIPGRREPTEIFYEGPSLSIRTVISELRRTFGEFFPTKPEQARIYKILQEFRTKLPESTSRSVISENMTNEICQRLGWDVVFRAR